MTIMLRDRPDGQVEVVLNRPEVIGVMRDHDFAAQFVAFLTERDPELKLAGDVVPFTDDTIEELVAVINASDGTEVARHLQAVSRQLPTVSAKPKLPARPKPLPMSLTESQREAAFDRIQEGEPLAAVAACYDVAPAQLRGAFGAYRKSLQRHLAEGGQVPCRLCQTSFIPSISHPETCARCSHV